MALLVRAVATLQALYYLVSGVWPLVHMSSFEAITGPKADRWLVRTAGVLITAIGAVLLADAPAPRRTTGLLAGWSATGLAAIEIREVARGRISAVYLLDALLELAFVAASGLGLAKASTRQRPRTGTA